MFRIFFDNFHKISYNIPMERIKFAIIGGGASGLFLANALKSLDGVCLFERGNRLGRKLSATGNGQGNLTNLRVGREGYFALEGGAERAKAIVRRYDDRSLREFMRERGVLCIADERGRVYPSSRQASALTDALRFSLAERGADIRLDSQALRLRKEGDGFLLDLEGSVVHAEKVAICVGGKAAKNFGTDGTGYALATALGHTVTQLYPSLVQIKTDTQYTKTLKGVRVVDGGLTVKTPDGEYVAEGDILFTEYGVSGDAVFRASAFLSHCNEKSCFLSVDFLPRSSEEEIYALLREKAARYPRLETSELLFGVVNNQAGRAIFRRAKGDLAAAARLVKDFSLPVTGSLGFDYAQVTKGGIPLREVTDGLESVYAKGLYFAGEVLDVDGECGGFNLQWAYASARQVVAEIEKGRGQV